MISGDYKIINKQSHICIDTLTSPIEDYLFEEAFIVGSHKTENLGIERIILNIIENPHVKVMIICGKESPGHNAGQALYCLHAFGVDDEKKIIGAKGPAPYLENVTKKDIEKFRNQIEILEDMIDITCIKTVHNKVKELC